MIQSPSQTTFHKIEKCIKEYRRFAQRNINEEVDNITVDQALLLIFLNDHPTFSQQEIGELIFKDNASVTRMIDLMAKKEFLQRSINMKDRRKYHLTVTDQGKNIIDDLNPVIASNRKKALDGVTDEELSQLEQILSKIIQNCRS